MSNFICSECGMNNIDCGGAGYKTPKEIELERQVELLRGLLDRALETMGQIAKLSDSKVDAVQCAIAVCLIQEKLEEMEGVK